MKKSTYAFALAAIAFAGLTGCTQDNKEVIKKLDDITQRLDRLEKRPVGAGGGQQRPSRPMPDPAKTYAVPVDDIPSVGKPDALITIVKAYEYACPFCEKVRPTLEQIHKDYGDNVRVVYAPYVVHPAQATLPAQATCAAYRQGKFKEIDELLWTKVFKERKFEEPIIVGLGKEAGLDESKYASDLKGDCAPWVQKHQAMLSNFGVGATPAFFINGRYLSGAQPLPAFKAIIDEELKKAQDRVAQGTPANSYYKTWVVEKGLKKLDPPK